MRKPKNKTISVILLSVCVLALGSALLFSPTLANTFSMGLFEIKDSQSSTSGATLSDDGREAIASSNEEVSEVGASVLASGGNAIDAAIAMAYVSAIDEPHTSGPGGGGGALVRLPNGDSTFVDFREISDGSRTMRSDKLAIPAFFYGMDYLHEKYGEADRHRLFEPAIYLAENGVKVSKSLHNALNNHSDRFAISESPYYEDGEPAQEGTTIRLPEAATTLKGVRDNGAEYFYTEVLSKDQPSLDFTVEDLNEYLVVEREPVESSVSGYTVQSAPAPFSGSSLIQYLSLLESHQLPPLSTTSENQLLDYLVIGNTVNRSRSDTVADPRFGGTDVVMKNNSLISDVGLAGTFRNEESISTTHFSVADKDGMLVSMTITLGHYFGNGEIAGGFYLNNSNAFASNGINVYEPFKKPRSFMSPTILTNEEEVLALGTPGGNKIPQILGQAARNYFMTDDLQEAVEAPRMVSDDSSAFIEQYRSKADDEALASRNYEVSYDEAVYNFGAVNIVRLNSDGSADSYADSRRNTAND